MAQGILINGLMLGGIYALLAVGFSLIFGVARILNMVQTAFYMLGAYFVFTFTTGLGLDVFPAAIISIAIPTLIGLAIYRFCLDRIREHENTVLLVTIGLAMVFQECIILFFGRVYRATPAFISGFWEVLGVRVSYQHLITLGVVAVVLVGVWALLYKTKLGVATRATAQDREIANVMGIRVGRMCLIAYGIATAIAAIAGVVVAPIFSIEPHMWLDSLIIVCAVVVLGGLGSIKGSIIGAFILSFAETAVVFLMPMGSFLRLAVALMVMIIVLVVRPEGLFGVVFEEERL